MSANGSSVTEVVVVCLAIAFAMLWAGFRTNKPYRWALIFFGGIAVFAIISTLVLDASTSGQGP